MSTFFDEMTLDEYKSFVIPNWEVRWAYDKAFGRAVDVFNEMGVERRNIKPLEGGLYSRDLGSVNADKDLREYTCLCGNLHGRHREGDICEDCGTPVEEQYGYDLSIYGWIDISPFYIINAAAYRHLEKVIGATALKNILKSDIPIDAEGIVMGLKEKPSSLQLYQNIGILEFKKRFKEIMYYYAKIKPKKAEHALFLIKMESRVFSTKIPVFSSLLRPVFASSSKKMFSYDKINANYTAILNNTKILKKGVTGKMKIPTLTTLFAIQTSLNDVYDLIVDTKIKGKYKIIRASILSNRMMYSARAVVTSLIGTHSGVDHLTFPYKGFLKLYEIEILNCMMRGIPKPNLAFMRMTIYELLEYTKKAMYSDELDKDLYEIMIYLIRNHKDGLLIAGNRNPSMEMLSIQAFFCKHVYEDPLKKVAGIQTTSLKAFNGDFDGDEFNFFSPKEKCIHDMLKKGMNPRYHMIDASADNSFNRDFNILKHHATNIIGFMTPIEE